MNTKSAQYAYVYDESVNDECIKLQQTWGHKDTAVYTKIDDITLILAHKKNAQTNLNA